VWNAALSADVEQTVASDDEQQRNLGVLLLDERGSGSGADRAPADSSVSSFASVSRGVPRRSLIARTAIARLPDERGVPTAGAPV
jgi:hypothetical protein